MSSIKVMTKARGRKRKRPRNVRKVQRSHGTYYISIPIDLVRQLDWKERQKVVVKKRGKGLVVRDWQK